MVAAGLGMACGGALLALGLATPAAGAAVTGTMAVAAEMHVPGGFFAHEGGVEYVAFLGVAAAAVAITGSGELSVDALLGHRLNRPWMRNLALAAAAPAAAFVIRRRRQALAATNRPGRTSRPGRPTKPSPPMLKVLVAGTGIGCQTHVHALRGAGFDVVALVGRAPRGRRSGRPGSASRSRSPR